MLLRLGLSIASQVTQTARLARDLWLLVNDTWQLEARKWEDIV